MKRALFIGIDTYAALPLRGCVDDASSVFLQTMSLGLFDASQSRMLTDDRATAAAIRERLDWLVNGAAANDQLLFYFSGHGVQLSSRDAAGDVVRTDDAICPVDFNPDDRKTYLNSDDFWNVFKTLPADCCVTWICDACHSGVSSDQPLAPGQKRYPLPPDVGWARARAAAELGLSPLRLADRASENTQLKLTYLGACAADQLAYEVTLADGSRHGALTAALLACMSEAPVINGPANTLVQRLALIITTYGVDQVPELDGCGDYGKRPLFEDNRVVKNVAPPAPQTTLVAIIPAPKDLQTCNPATIALIKKFEGLGPNYNPDTQRVMPYPDPIRIWTIGWGHVIVQAKHQLKSPTDDALVHQLYPAGISLADAEVLLKGDLITFEAIVRSLVKVAVTDNQFGALVSFTFNLGATNFASSTLLKLLNAGDYSGAADQFHRWIYADHQVMSGLIARRAAESKLFLA